MYRLTILFQFRLLPPAIVETVEMYFYTFPMQRTEGMINLKNTAIIGWERHVKRNNMKMFIQRGTRFVDRTGARFFLPLPIGAQQLHVHTVHSFLNR